MNASLNFEKSRRPERASRCTRCEDSTADLKHGYCPACRSELAAEKAAEDRAIRLAYETSIYLADVHEDVRRASL